MKKIRNIVCVALVFAILSCNGFFIPSVDAQKMDSVITSNIELSEEDFFIDQETAAQIAQLFLNDALKLDDVLWTDKTSMQHIEVLFDSDLETITAYGVEFDTGYVIVSAWADVFPLILEWSDEATPLYQEFSQDEETMILYGGGMNYYLDTGTSRIQALDGSFLLKESMENSVLESRNRETVPSHVITAVADFSGEEVVSINSDYITDPYDHAAALYGGEYGCIDFHNEWGNYIEYMRTGQFRGYVNHCGPVAITGLIRCYGNRYNINSINILTTTTIFTQVAEYGIEHLYYYNTNSLGGGGTSGQSAGEYIDYAFGLYNVNPTVEGRINLTYSNVKSSIDSGALLYVMVHGHDVYETHHMIGFAYTNLRNLSNGTSVQYIKLADGHSDSSARYLCMNEVSSSDKYWEISF